MRGRPATPIREDEDALHLAVAEFLRVAWPDDLVWLHVPNGGGRVKLTRTRRDGSTYTYSPEAEKLKRMGVRKGAWDLWFQLPRGRYGWIELKADDGRPTPEQVEFGELIGAHGGGREICRSVEEVEATLTRWLAPFGRRLKATTVTRRSA